MLNPNFYLALVPGANIHLFGDGAILQVGEQCLSMNKVAIDILSKCNGKTPISSLCQEVIQQYSNRNPTQQEISTILDKIEGFLSILLEMSLILYSNNQINTAYTITGIREKYYPRKLTLELTNCCNLRCTHCFKEACSNNTHYLDYSIIEDINNNLSGKTYEIQLTGGEPTLHPEIEKIIKLLTKHFKVSLLTNGTQLKRISDETLQTLRRVQISLYGYCKEVFSTITDTDGHLFENIGHSIERLILVRESQVTVVLNSFTVNHMEDYIQYAISHHAKEIKFSIASPMGRAVNKGIVEWLIDNNTVDNVEAQLKLLHEKYNDKINVVLWEKEAPCQKEGRYKVLNVNMPVCGAGGLDYCITETGRLKPCQILPHKFEIGDYHELETIINSGIIDQNNLYSEYAMELFRENIDPSLICPILKPYENKQTKN